MNTVDRWLSIRKVIAIVALTTTAVLGVGGAANAASAPTTAVESPARVASHAAAGMGGVGLGLSAASDSFTSRGEAAGGIRESRSALGAVVTALKAIPGLWSKFSSSVAKSYAAFVPLWNGIKAAIGAIGNLVSAKDVWNSFH